MPRYIDVDNAIYRLKKLALHDSQPRAIIRGARYLAEFAEEATHDVQEVKHGKWNYGASDGAWCSVCCFEADIAEVQHNNYCPNCGAKMDLDDN